MSEKSDNPSKGSEMVSAEASQLVREVAGPRLLGDNTKALLARAARRLGFSFTRTRSIYYGEARAIRAEEWIKLNEEAAHLRESARARREALHELDRMVAAGLGAQAAGKDARPHRLESNAGEPSLPFTRELDAD